MEKATFQRFIQGILGFAMFEMAIFAVALVLPITLLQLVFSFSFPEIEFSFSVAAIAFSLGFSGGLMTIVFSIVLKIKADMRLESHNILQLVVATMVLVYTSWRIYLDGDVAIWYFSFGCCLIPMIAAYIPYLIGKAQGGLPEQKVNPS